jgi:hypothetical protein
MASSSNDSFLLIFIAFSILCFFAGIIAFIASVFLKDKSKRDARIAAGILVSPVFIMVTYKGVGMLT